MQARRSSADIDATLRRIAVPRLGLVTVADAARHGVDRFALERRRKAGALLPLFPGVMRLAAVEPSPEQTILAAALAVRGSTIAATSAAVVHQWPIGPIGPVAGRPTLTVSPTTSARTPGVAVIRQTFRMPTQWWRGERLATPASTLLLLPRFVDAQIVERCLDHSLAHRLTTVAVVGDLLARLPARAIAGRQLLRELLAQRSAGLQHRSDLEQKVARWLVAAGLRSWRANYRVTVADGDPVEVDFAWREAKVALEVSPFFTHGSRAAQDRDAVRRRLLVAEGWRIVEATDPDLESQQAFAGTVVSLQHLLGEAPCAVGSSQRYLLHNLAGPGGERRSERR